jgi:hypothetical protein
VAVPFDRRPRLGMSRLGQAEHGQARRGAVTAGLNAAWPGKGSGAGYSVLHPCVFCEALAVFKAVGALSTQVRWTSISLTNKDLGSACVHRGASVVDV